MFRQAGPELTPIESPCMSFDTPIQSPRKVAVIGAGISGMGAAHALLSSHRVTLFEAEKRLGGHARTVMAGKRGEQPVDTGFIVFNHVNYPNLVRLFDDLGVPTTPSSMSFGVSIRDGWLDYALNDLDALFAQRGNVLRPQYLRMLRDIFRFNARAEAAVRPGMTMRDLISDLGLGPWFRDYYLTPFSGAIWSTPKEKILDFPADALIRFFKNHHLLHHTGQHQWYTVEGGSIEYVTRLEARMRAAGVDLRLGCAVQSVTRHPGAARPSCLMTSSLPPIPMTACACWPIQPPKKRAIWAPSPISPMTSCCIATKA